ncbi:MAG TPA: SNF2-related protein [Pirellulales bacterium]|nr:SNF2-related protein [Pirellulales bacterium]
MPGVLADRCRRSLSKRCWNAGAEYCRLRRVEIKETSKNGLTALVCGTQPEPYVVTLDWSSALDDELLAVCCTCPRFEDGYLCKHVAAVILQADKDGYGRHAPGRETLEVIEDVVFENVDAALDYADDWEPVFELTRSGPSPSRRTPTLPKSAVPQRAQSSASNWQRRLQTLALYLGSHEETLRSLPNESKQRLISFRLSAEEIASRRSLVVDFFQREEKRNGQLGKLKPFSISARDIDSLDEAADRELFRLLLGNHVQDRQLGYYYSYHSSASFPPATRCELAPTNYERLLPVLCASGRFGWGISDRRGSIEEDFEPLVWDDGPPWQYQLRLQPLPRGRGWKLDAGFHRAGERLPLSAVRFAGHGVALFERSAARFEGVETRWLTAQALDEGIEIPVKQLDDFMTKLSKLPGLPALELPAETGWRETTAEPTPCVKIKPPEYGGQSAPLVGHLSFDYRGQTAAWSDSCEVVADSERRELVRRNADKEQAAWRELLELRARPQSSSHFYRPRSDFDLQRRLLPAAVGRLVSLGWEVEAEGHKLRKSGSFKINVTSHVDWFELDAQVDFEGASASLPDLLKALQRGESFVKLGDGSHGVLPEEWLERYAPLAELGRVQDGKLRFSHMQALLLDAWLAEQPGVDLDAEFRRVRDRLQSFRGIKPADEPKGFQGRLRDYQRLGLGWLNFLDEFGFGGCLADDMGLGKTVQVLALLESARARAHGQGKRSSAAPSLVVAPRSLIHNWVEEAGRFAPQLQVLDYTGLGRAQQRKQFADHDLIVTTYGTLRRDVGHLKDVDFDYCILDEAQAIKNADSQAAKACRLLPARRRLAMTGTPVENHLGELWSIFEFLNPGMLGRSSLVKRLSSDAVQPDANALSALAKGLRPFLLRRTKEQVLKELPAKTEQTLFCTLEKKQRKQYDDLLRHYRDSLGKRIESAGLKNSKIQVLEALLRLRQAACHPGLLDSKLIGESSAKLNTLLEQVAEVLDGGHKALVFSQFTSLLAIVRKQLDRQGVAYEYLDGKTRDRKARVERFQQDPACPLFLISLKAGGLGLNLTAADYVFILDPWWNPAVESQAVDRAHRLGQTRRVFAYRLIARDTIEEKILQLQADKRLLAEAIVSADNRVISKLSADDLQWLLS